MSDDFDPDDAAILVCAALRLAGNTGAILRLRREDGKIIALDVLIDSVPFASFPLFPPLDLSDKVASAYLHTLQAKASAEIISKPVPNVRTLGLRHGDRVEVAIELGPPTEGLPPPPYPVHKGDRGTVARIIHCSIEGEPIEGPSINPIVHVRFDGRAEVLAFARECLRVVP